MAASDASDRLPGHYYDARLWAEPSATDLITGRRRSAGKQIAPAGGIVYCRDWKWRVLRHPPLDDTQAAAFLRVPVEDIRAWLAAQAVGLPEQKNTQKKRRKKHRQRDARVLPGVLTRARFLLLIQKYRGRGGTGKKGAFSSAWLERVVTPRPKCSLVEDNKYKVVGWWHGSE